MNDLPKEGQLTLVAFYGDKNEYSAYRETWEMIQEAQKKLIGFLGEDRFESYEVKRVHGTIVGLEGIRIGDVILNENYYKELRNLRCMRIQELLSYLFKDDNEILPITLKIGGYKDGHQYSFTSRNLHPYFRSFSIQGKNVVAMGWPFEDDTYPSTIDRLRRRFNDFNVLHKYHNSLQAFDNDFFFVLGKLKVDLDENTLLKCQDDMRRFFSDQDTQPFKLSKNELRIVVYPMGDTSFKNASGYKIDQAINILTELHKVYPTLKC